MKLYHGTTATVARIAQREGLLSRRTRAEADDTDLSPGNWEAHPSGDDRVYLTSAYAAYFASAACEEPGERWAIIEVDTDQLDLYPDEDFLEQASRGMTVPTEAGSLEEQQVNPYGPPWSELTEAGTDIGKRTAWFRDHAIYFSHLAKQSIELLGTCAVYDEIPPEAITRIAYLDPLASDGNRFVATRAMDPTISLLNYAIVGDTYRALLEWCMGARVTRKLARRICGIRPLDLTQAQTTVAKNADPARIIEELMGVENNRAETAYQWLKDREVEIWTPR